MEPDRVMSSVAELSTLTQSDLVERAKALGINVREGKAWRAKKDIFQDCISKLSSQALPGGSNGFTRQLRSSGCKIVIDLDSQDESVIHLDSQNESVIDLDSQNESEQENVAQTEKPPKKKKKRNKARDS